MRQDFTFSRVLCSECVDVLRPKIDMDRALNMVSPDGYIRLEPVGERVPRRFYRWKNIASDKVWECSVEEFARRVGFPLNEAYAVVRRGTGIIRINFVKNRLPIEERVMRGLW